MRVTVITSPGARCRAFGKLNTPALSQITNGEAITSTLRTTEGRRRLSLRAGRSRPHIGVMNLDLTDAETEALIQELRGTINYDRYPFSPRIRSLRAILGTLRPEPVREPLPPPKVYAPPRASTARRRRAGQ